MNDLFGYQSLMNLQLYMNSTENSNNKNKSKSSNKFNMIKAIKGFLFAMLLGLTTIANANVAPKVPYVMFEQIDGQKVRLNLANLQDESSQLSIVDAEGTILFTETVEETEAKAYDFSTLPSGNYTIKLELEDRIVSQEAIVAGETLTLVNFEAMAKPIFKVAEDTFDIYFSGIVDADVTIEIFDETGETVYEKIDKSVNSLHRQYNMENLPNGDYTVKVTIDGQTHYKTITL